MDDIRHLTYELVPLSMVVCRMGQVDQKRSSQPPLCEYRAHGMSYPLRTLHTFSPHTQRRSSLRSTIMTVPLLAAFALSAAPVSGLHASGRPRLGRRRPTTAAPTSARRAARMTTPPTGNEDSPPPFSTAGKAAVVAAFLTFPTVAVSEYALLTTGCGLPPGPGGLIGAVEGVGYLAVAAIVVWSVVTKVQTGKGLPSGPGGVLGAIEGLAWLLALSGLGAGAFVVWKFGGLPEAVPGAGSRCFPME